jgi:hypothetical protein
LGSIEEAWEMASMGRKLAGGMPLGEGYFGYLASVLGHAVEAREVVEKLEVGREKGYVPVLPMVWI